VIFALLGIMIAALLMGPMMNHPDPPRRPSVGRPAPRPSLPPPPLPPVARGPMPRDKRLDVTDGSGSSAAASSPATPLRRIPYAPDGLRASTSASCSAVSTNDEAAPQSRRA
jgi:hypothetical protein